MLKPALLALVALLISCFAALAPAMAGERLSLAAAEEWGLALYAGDDEAGGLPSGGLALNLGFDGLPQATLALDYSDNDERPGEIAGLGLIAAIDLLGGAESARFLRLSYRAGDSSLAIGDSTGGVEQTVALRAGLRW
jgi:hypothetical protein